MLKSAVTEESFETNMVVLEYSMLHTKFQVHWPFGSREEDFGSFLAYMGMAAILVM